MSTVTTDAGRVAALEAEIARLRDEHAVALALVADVRLACGDDGKRMQPELIEYLNGLRADAERLGWLGRHPRLAQIQLDDRVEDCYFYGISGAVGLTLREVIDAAMAAAAKGGA